MSRENVRRIDEMLSQYPLHDRTIALIASIIKEFERNPEGAMNVFMGMSAYTTVIGKRLPTLQRRRLAAELQRDSGDEIEHRLEEEHV
jgi:hypothetical protein